MNKKQFESGKCECKQLTCKKDCKREHTHKTFFCEKCEPEKDKRMFPAPHTLDQGKPIVQSSQRCNPTPEKREWEDELLKSFFVYKLGGKFPDHVGAQNDLINFVAKVEQRAYQKVEAILVDEINICHHENTPTSRLTSAIMKIKALQDGRVKK